MNPVRSFEQKNFIKIFLLGYNGVLISNGLSKIGFCRIGQTSNGMNQLDITIFRWLNSWVGYSAFIDWTIIFRAEYLWYIMAGAVIALSVFTFLPRFRQYRKRHLELLYLASVSALSARLVMAELIRYLYHRPRPFVELEGVRQLFEHSAGGSFPSGHASFAFAIAAAFYFYYPKTSILFFIAAVNVGAARVIAGVHWPSDILGGAVVGIGSAWFARWIWDAINKLEKEK